MSPRPGPAPVLPESAFVTIADNHYFKRDPRRESAPPQVIVSGVKQITAKDDPQSKPVAAGIPTPGRAFKWTEV